MTNHAVVAMIGDEVKQTRCSTCDAEHEYKHAKVPRQRRKAATPAALYSQVAAAAPKRHTHEPSPIAAEPPGHDAHDERDDAPPYDEAVDAPPTITSTSNGSDPHAPDAAERPEPLAASEPFDEDDERAGEDEGPVHRPLIRASLPRPEGQAPPARTLPEFTIRQPGGRPNRFRPRHQRGGFGGGGQSFQGNRNGNVAGNTRGGGMPRHGGGNRPPMMKRHGGGGRKRSK